MHKFSDFHKMFYLLSLKKINQTDHGKWNFSSIRNGKFSERLFLEFNEVDFGRPGFIQQFTYCVLVFIRIMSHCVSSSNSEKKILMSQWHLNWIDSYSKESEISNIHFSFFSLFILSLIYNVRMFTLSSFNKVEHHTTNGIMYESFA